MYKVVETDKEVKWNGIVHPLITLADEYGGKAQIVLDDHCFVLLLKTNPDVPNIPSEESPVCAYKPTYWWFKEAVNAMATEEDFSETEDLVEDGFGTATPAVCSTCGCRAVYVCRPGDIRCGVCYDGNPKEDYIEAYK